MIGLETRMFTKTACPCHKCDRSRTGRCARQPPAFAVPSRVSTATQQDPQFVKETGRAYLDSVFEIEPWGEVSGCTHEGGRRWRTLRNNYYSG